MREKARIDAEVFWKEVRSDTARAYEAVNNLDQIAQTSGSTLDEEEENNREILMWVMERLHLRLVLATDALGAESFRTTVERSWSKFQKSPTALEYSHSIGGLYCPALEYISDALRVLSMLITDPQAANYRDEQDLVRLQQILEGTPKLIRDQGLQPRSEKEVRTAMYGLLLHFFPDTVREVPIAKVSKTYKPDIGIRSLKVGIEYKFADSELELKTCIGGIFEDILGYSGSADWTTFYAVIYMTDAFMTRAQVQSEWQLSNVPHEWRPILVTGRGERRKKFPGKGRRTNRATR